MNGIDNMFKWSNLPKGFLMGIVELVPGVSSGTMALLLGIYDQFLGALSRLVSKFYKNSIGFLLPIVIGMALAILSVSSLLNYLLQSHTIPTHWFFMGMVLGVIPMLLRISNAKVEFKIPHYILIIIGIAVLFFMSLANTSASDLSSIPTDAVNLIKYFFSGVLAAAIMLLPGISGSLVLLIIGVYPIIIFAIDEFTSFNFYVLPVLLSTGVGIIVGILLGSRLIAYLLRRFTYLTYAGIVGLLFGSLFAIYPGLPTNIMMWIVSIVVFILGCYISYVFGKYNE
ncbi:DUF368 domain-containing protein [Jeotgalicoccus huakuii]|uniref:DUF368 domain-containing protein n=1 Tax=Jeotgalicoccus TaxID=227979 RepID=UPI00041DEE86|nr:MULTISPECIES: DUF368 domain-containing protein [Jeotgalicoccus]MCK1976462.1 DUF368 domain-containing protein [Jeotgalicoccus huakuii]